MAEEGLTPRPGAWERTWREALDPEGSFRFVVAHLARRIVGCMSLHFHFSTYNGLPIASIEDVFVEESHRGAGIGRRLLEFAQERALDRKAARIELHVRHGNRAARLYARFGLEPVSYRWMQKRLTAESVIERPRPRPRRPGKR